MKSKKQKLSNKKEKAAAPKKPNEGVSIDDAISFCINTIAPQLEENIKKSLVKALSGTIKDIDKEIQYIRDTRLRAFLRLHVDNKLVTEFMDSLAPLKIIDHLSSRSV